MPLWSANTSGIRPKWFSDDQKRNVIATPAGWVRRVQKKNGPSDEVLVPIRNLESSMTFPSIQEIYVANSTGGTSLLAGETTYVYAVFDEPVAFDTAGYQIDIANTASRRKQCCRDREY